MTPRPTPQGVNSPTFHPAPFEHGLSIPGLYKYHAIHSPNHPVFTYSDPVDGSSHDIVYSEAWKDIGVVANRVSDDYSNADPLYARRGKDIGHRPVIGVLAVSDSIGYIYLELAIMSLGFTAFPLSPRNSAAVTAHLLEKTGVVQLFVSGDLAMQTLAQDAVKILADKGLEVQLLPMVKYADLKRNTDNDNVGDAKMVDIADDHVTLILHSSGTTAFPKPINITRRGLVNLSNIPCFGEVDLAGKRVAAHTNPIFHAMGLATIIWPISSGAIFALYNPLLPVVIPTPANFLAHWVADQCNIVFCVPVFIEAWARDPSNLATLKALDSIVFSGASVSRSTGDMLAREGVVMHPFWGSTEVGPATMFVPRDAPPVDEWEYFKFSHHIEFVMQPQDNLAGIVEPIMIPTETCFPHVTNSELDGQRVFAVGDLLEQHPSDPGRWKVFGRKDDQIMLSTGENVNPVPIEAALAQDKHIASAIMFGRDHIETGVLVEPAAGIAVPPGDSKKLDEFKDLIWPTVEQVNAKAPAYARIQRNMIVVTSSAKPLEHTPKGTPRRPVCLKLYASEIEAVYPSEEDASIAAHRQFPDRI
ncbi:acetyl-CoA synthetase-like protein [Amylostereum chailletii]|nr:acetyl-CoA synthetase-like protein [Amylostereum chailletii]